MERGGEPGKLVDLARERGSNANRRQTERVLTLADLNHFAAISRVQRIMQPYIEAIIQ
jgi:hypothetical protein